MKKFIIIFALTGFIVTGVNQTVNAQTQQEQSKTLPQEQNEFSSIELTDLPEEVRVSVLKNDMAANIQSAEVKNLTTGDKVYRVAIKSAEKGEYSLELYADGRAYEK